MRDGLLYIVSRDTKYTFLQQQKIFSVTFFIEPVDNFCYTYDSSVPAPIPQVSQSSILCYPQTVDNPVDNFKILWKILLKQAIPTAGKAWKIKPSNLWGICEQGQEKICA